MWNSGFPFSPLILYIHSPILLTTPHPYPNLLQPISIKPQDFETKDELPENLNSQPEFLSKISQKRSIEPHGKRRRLSTKQKFKRRRQRQDKFQRKKQKKDRNLPSNIIKNFFHFLSRHPNLSQFLRSSLPPEAIVDIDGFALKLKQVIEQQKSYIRPIVLQSLWRSEGLDHDEGILFRIVLRKFLTLLEPIMLASKESFRKAQKLDYLRSCRKLWSQFQHPQPS